MGRQSTGAISTREACRIELNFLLRQGLIKKGYSLQGQLSWTNGNEISIITSYTEEEKYIRLIYTLTETTGEKKKYDYKIKFAEVPSNLGRGSILYFICPVSWNYCRILYKCYGSHIWKSRKAYTIRIYYENQNCSKYDYFNTRYWQIEKQINKQEAQKKSYFYKGIETKRFLKLLKLREKKEKFEELRWTIGIPKRLKKYYNLYDL